MSNPNGESLVMELPVYSGIRRSDLLFNNYPNRDRPQNM